LRQQLLQLILASNASAKTEGNYLGADLVGTSLDFKEERNNGGYFKGKGSDVGYGVGLNYKYAFNFSDFFIAPGVFFEYNNTEAKIEDAGNSADNRSMKIKSRHGVKADFGYDINDMFAPYVTVGYANVAYQTKNWNNSPADLSSKSGNNYGFFIGTGLKFEPVKDFSLNLEYNVQETFNAKTTPSANSKGYETKISVLKLGAAYHF